MDLRRLCCVGLCACGVALVVLEVPSLRFILASQAGLAIGWRIAAMPPNILTGAPLLRRGYSEPFGTACLSLIALALSLLCRPALTQHSPAHLMSHLEQPREFTFENLMHRISDFHAN